MWKQGHGDDEGRETNHIRALGFSAQGRDNLCRALSNMLQCLTGSDWLQATKETVACIQIYTKDNARTSHAGTPSIPSELSMYVAVRYQWSLHFRKTKHCIMGYITYMKT